jgi:hypothetical protein
MKAALALIFFACIAGSMAESPLQGLLQQGQGIVATIVGTLQGQIQQILHQALGGLSGLLGSIGGRFDFNSIFDAVKPMISQAFNQLLGSLNGGLVNLIGGIGGMWNSLTLYFF